MSTSGVWGPVCVVVGLIGSTASAVNMEPVIVGNPGNTPDTRYTGYRFTGGDVDYTYRIARFEVTAGQYTEFLNAVAKTDTYGLYNKDMGDSTFSYGCNIQRSGAPGSYAYSVAPDWANRPVNFVSWGDAVRFANWMHNGQRTGAQDASTTEDGSYYLNGATTGWELWAVIRQANATWVIPSEDEWYKAAYHRNDGATGNYWDYPTGTDSTPSNQLIDPDPGNNANFPSGYALTIGRPHWRTEVGAFENSEAPYGTFDQAGNVWEWTDMRIGGHGLPRIVRGGGFFPWLPDADTLHAAFRRAPFQSYETNDIGFRLALVPEPGTMVMLALAGAGILGRRRP